MSKKNIWTEKEGKKCENVGSTDRPFDVRCVHVRCVHDTISRMRAIHQTGREVVYLIIVLAAGSRLSGS